MAAQTYTQVLNATLVALAQAPSPYNVIPPDFAEVFPLALSYAEDRIYGEIPFLGARVDAALATVTGDREIDLTAAANPLLVVEGVALITPAGTAAAAGTRQIFDKASLDFIDSVWPDPSQTMAPEDAVWLGRWWAMKDATTVVLGPTPDDVYNAVVTALERPASLSVSNPETYLSKIYPDLLTAGALVYLAGVITRNFGQQSDDPKMALSWESTFGTLLGAAKDEEMRRRGMRPDVPR